MKKVRMLLWWEGGMCAGPAQSIHTCYTAVAGEGDRRDKGRKTCVEVWEAGEKGELSVISPKTSLKGLATE